MDHELILFTRKEFINKPGMLRKLYYVFKSPDENIHKSVVYAEEIFIDFIAKILKLKVHKKYDTESLTVEDPFGHYP